MATGVGLSQMSLTELIGRPKKTVIQESHTSLCLGYEPCYSQFCVRFLAWQHVTMATWVVLAED